MHHDVEVLIERRRLRRRASLWRALALVFVVLTIAVVSWRFTEGSDGEPHIARLEISGLIASADDYVELIDKIEKSGAQGLILAVNSPGGGMTASEILYKRIRAFAEKKPVVASFGALAASGGYMAGLGADRIFAYPSSITGSIGVLVQYPDVTELLDTIGVRVEAARSSPLKAQPDGVTPTPPEARVVLETLVSDSYGLFRNMVAERRKLSGAALDAVADGRVVIGTRARELGMVDELGGEKEARQWLETEKGIDKDLPVREWKKPARRFPYLTSLAAVADLLGWNGLAADLRTGGTSSMGMLDGVAAVWHPSLEKQ